jgi:hypothetical protein
LAAPGENKRLRLTLPSEAGKATLSVGNAPLGQLSRVHFSLPLEWESNFRPDAIKSVEKENGATSAFRLTDEAGHAARLSASARMEAIVRKGKLEVQVLFPEPDAKAFGDVTGQVVDRNGQPIAGAGVAVAMDIRGGDVDWRLQTVTGPDGRYVLKSNRPARPRRSSMSPGWNPASR